MNAYENLILITQYSRHLVILCEPDGMMQDSIAGRMKTIDCLVLKSPSKNIAERFQSYALQLFTKIQQLLTTKQEGKILLQLVIRNLPEHQLFAGLAGLLMTAHLENPNLIGQLITIAPNEDAENIVVKLKTNAQTPLDQRIDYQNGERWIAGWKEIPISNDEVFIPWKEKGKYLITGGLGGLGLIFSKEIAQQICDATIILAGRSPLNETKQQLIQSLEKLCIKSSTHIEYRQVNVCDSQSVTNLIEDINQNFGYLDGIIHAAGVIHDNFIIKKTPQELEKVLAPKVMGSVNLDQATKDQPLDFFFFCSSLAGAIGNVGQADYACANAFMDCYAKYRNQLVQSHQRQGRSLSINWPLWQEGGMRVDESIEKMMAQSIGLVAMPTAAGIRALYQAFASDQDQVMILEGDVAKLKQFFLNLPEKTVKSQESDSQTALDDRQLKQKTLDQLKSLFAEITKLPLNKIDPEEPLENYGIDSIIISQLNHKLTERLGSVSQTLFYQFQNLADLAHHLATNYTDGCQQWIDWNTLIAIPNIKVESVKTQPVLIPNVATKQPIAIIGLSGRYPKAKTIAEFWQKLQNGECCIEEIPKQRWDWQHHYHPDRNQAVKLGKSYSKWGGFLEDFDQFDPMFFNMTPREAANIDPQERLFLEESWKALEDAGYSPSHISADLRQRIGVFAGITKQGFNLYRTELENSDRNAIFPTTSYASLVNRVSYFLNIQGPSFPIDTMCSSSLVAIHEACEYIRSGKGDMAIVGGVNLYAHPSSYLELSLGKFVSSSSICAAFEKDGDGFVPGEGVGAVILKSYDQAIKDRDNIYALIRGSAVNHDGKTNGYKTPNPEPKATVIRQALQDSGIDARSISYIEAAAQGSEMGDAIEASALTEVFRDRHNVEGAYRIGSVKPNIGHCESASGMSQLTKVILSLHNKTLVPTLRSRELSPSIDFQRLPFELQQDLSEWKTVSVDGVEVPRRAGIMNIGAGGVNACVIVEEYPVNVEPVSESQEPVLFVLSAKNEERLEQYVQDWLIYLKNHQNLDLSSIAYTLQVGRENMNCRLAFVVKKLGEIEQYLNRWLENRELGEIGFYGDITQAKIKNPEAVAARIKEGDADNALAVAKLWVQGNTIPWDEWHNERILDRINGLPTYPFVRRTCSIVPHENELSEAECNLENNRNLEPNGEENKVVEFYTRMSQDCDEEFQEEYLTFGAFPQRIPGFSMTRVAMNAANYPQELEMIKEKQREVRQVLFCRENFAKIHTVLDIGCGHGTDVIQIATLYPHIQTHGFTITESQAVLGNRRIENMNLGSRAHIYHKDSSKDKFPDLCDIILGVEVTFHIRDKDALFRKMADALSENGKILLMDYIGNLRGSIVDPNVEISIPTQQQWIDLLSKHNLIIDEIIDVSREISNYLYDPEHAEHTKHLPKVSQDSYRNYANQAIALEKGWITYNLLKLKKDTKRSEQERRDYNTQKIANQTPYSHALDEMLQIGNIPYPPMGELKKTELSVNKSKEISPPTLNENVPNLEKIKSILVNIFVNILGFAAQELKSIERLQLGELGITSINAVELLEAINTEFDLYLPTSIIFECHNLEDLAQYIQVELGRKPIISRNYNLSVTAEKYAASVEEKIPVIENNTDNDIAIIGISCRCAGAKDQEQFWQVVSQGKNCIADLNKPEWLDYIASHCSETFPIRYGMMPDLDYFDSLFFHISPREAKAMDATQRILLEECYRALEDAGYKPSSLKKKAVGTYIGAMGSASLGKGFSHFDMLGSETSILSARIAYFLDLKGPALTLNTACSSSLVAIDVASKALKSGEINLAIAGGVTLYQHPGTFIAMHNAGMLSKTGQCRPFDNNADGIVVGDGVGVVILKRLQEAQRDGDAIYGIIRGCGINQDGQTSSLTVPSFVSQSELESSVYQKANINLEDLQYIEAHGTATKLGDPIEIHALNKSFQSFTTKRKFCAIGSLKANVGHTTAAAGVLGVIKVLLSMKHQQIPPSINFDEGNQHIDFDNSPVYVNTQLKPWPLNAQGSRLAAVSSFGFSGTNAHLVLEHYIPRSLTEIDVFRPGVFLLSAESESTLQHYAYNVKRYLEDNPGIQFERFLYTFQVGREAFTYRLALIANNQQTLIQQLKQWLEDRGKSTENEKLVSRNNQEETALIQNLISAGKVEQLAQLWEQGTSVDWSVFYQSGLFHRLAGLPTYPFTGEYFGSDREPEIEQLLTVSSSSPETLICYPHWQEKAVSQTVESLEYERHLVLLSGMDHISVMKMQPKMPSVEFVHLAWANSLTLEKIYQDHFTQIFEIIQEILVSKNRVKTFIQCVVPQQTEKQCLSAISGILKTAQLENPKVFGQVIEVSADETEISLLKKLNENRQCPEDKQIRYYLGQRQVLAWKELVISNRTYPTPWREGGVYLITGGAGGLGLIFAEEIATKTQSSTIILTGRSDLSLEKQKSLFHQLQKLGARVEYWQADISNKNDVDLLMQRITKEYGSLNGILHCAGIVRDNFIIKKTSAEFQSVLAPKVAGVINLDAASKDLNLDFLVLFSSISGTMGNRGQADYAIANAFMDAFSSYRNDLVKADARWGQTLSINWPLWEAGGMQLDAHNKAAMKQSVGLETIYTVQGVQALFKGLASGQSQILVAGGHLPTLKKWLLREPSTEKTSDRSKINLKGNNQEKSLTQVEKQQLQEKTLIQLKGLLGESFGLAPNRIKASDAFEHYGIDSVIIIQLNQELAKVFPEISQTLFFEYQTSQALVAYLVDEYPQECMTWTGLKNKKAIAKSHEPETTISKSKVLNVVNSQVQEAIAIIGVSGHFSQADTLQDYWENLQAGIDCVGEIPSSRWSLEDFFVEDADEAIAQRKSYSKWGSFLEGFADFDPLFFGIPPRDVLSIDPQERLFLQASWEALEDAGYTRDTLREIYQQQVGVFAGITKTGFDLYGPELWKRGEQVFPHTSFSSVANRTSYFLNLQGPSLSIDTMCSSSLIAIHEACEHLHRQNCQLAFAGGVNLYLHPSTYVQMCALRMLSKDGKCKAFGKGGNGFVPGEGVGVVLLKPLSVAIRDRDHIYAIIRASHVNHDGKTNGYTVPNPKAQADLIRQTLNKAGVDARSISYIEAHGTGTELGDPIEITGLTQAFNKETADTGFCAIGSAKSNLGHLEAASGIAGLCKIILQLKAQKIVPSLHTEDLNPNIAFDKTPFVVQQTLSEWKRPIVEINGEVKEYPRRAGISSFGAGGSNAHLIIEEYAEEDVFEYVNEDIHQPVAIVLSAKNTEQLIKMADNLRCFLITQTEAKLPRLEDIAYTLQTGREAMEERLAMIVSSLDELENKLKSFVEGQEDIPLLYRGHLQQDRDLLADFASEEEFSTIIDEWIASKRINKLLNLWVKGFTIDWQKFYDNRNPQRISLPTYPFAKDYYWFDRLGLTQSNFDRQPNTTQDSATSRKIHYLQKHWVLDESRFDRSQHQKTVTGKVAILSTQETRLLATLLAEEFPNSQIIEFDHIKSQRSQSDTAPPNLGGSEYIGCIDLLGCCQDEVTSDSLDWILWLQCLIEKGSRTNLKLLGITQGLESFQNDEVNLSGASRVGLYRMLQSEYSFVQSRHVDIEPRLKTAALAEQIASEFLLNDDNCEVCYRDGKRYVSCLTECVLKAPKTQSTELQFAEEEVLLITGGTGGLGLLCAQHFAQHYAVKRLVLTGRETLPPKTEWATPQNDKVQQKIRAIQALEAQGVKVEVLSLNLSDRADVQESLHQITTNFGPIAGLLHCAGIVDSENPAFVRKSIADIAKVLEPKVVGLRSLLSQCQQQPLKFAVLFSSVSAIIPSLASGQSDYAMANTYMDYVAEATGGVLVSIQWSSWQEAGMGAANTPAYKQTGLLHQTNQEGLQLLDNILTSKMGPVVLPAVVHSASWNPQQLMKHQNRQINSTQTLIQNQQSQHDREPLTQSNISNKFTLDNLINLFSQELGIAKQKLDLDKSFADYGLDSIWLAQLTSKINQQLIEPIAPSSLYEYSSLKSLASWLTSEQASALKNTIIHQKIEPKNSEHTTQISPPLEKSQYISGITSPKSSSPKPLEIAIVGMSCQFPGAKNLDEYWTLLSEGKSSICPVSGDRWSSPTPFYAGLIDNITDFDPAFFLIPPEDAKVIDPQAFLVLEECLNLFYHAGYTLEEIKGSATGVFLGARSQHLVDAADLYQAKNPIVAAQNYLATHVSQFFDLKGPSLVIDTACSSALVGMNFAIQSLLSGEIDSAVVGGVSLLVNENAHRIFQQRNLLNQGSEFHIFDRRASGITLGEGVGLVLLKTLQQAQRDGDRIYAVIKSLAINNDGRTAGPATPNIKALKEVMQRALAQSAKQPQDIIHIEANGSGSEVTDLLELKAIEAVYRSENKTPCSLGSIKPNIGHPLCAEGIAGLIKLVCMLNHQQQVPFLSGQMPLTHYNIDTSPFYFCRQSSAWMETSPLVFALNCFADGGTNAHIIIESWCTEESGKQRQAITPPQLKRVNIGKQDAYPTKMSPNTAEISHNPWWG